MTQLSIEPNTAYAGNVNKHRYRSSVQQVKPSIVGSLGLKRLIRNCQETVQLPSVCLETVTGAYAFICARIDSGVENQVLNGRMRHLKKPHLSNS